MIARTFFIVAALNMALVAGTSAYAQSWQEDLRELGKDLWDVYKDDLIDEISSELGFDLETELEEMDEIIQQFEEYFVNNPVQGTIAATSIGAAGVLYANYIVGNIEDALFGYDITKIPMPDLHFESTHYNFYIDWELTLDSNNDINGGNLQLLITY